MMSGKQQLCVSLTLLMSIVFYAYLYMCISNWKEHNIKHTVTTRDFSRNTGAFTFEEMDEYFTSERSRNGINCHYLSSLNDTAAEENVRIINNTTTSLYIERETFTNCEDLTRGYIKSSLTKEEEEFPIAYTILMYKDVDQVWTLLQSIYRPQNVYCIHIDTSRQEQVQTLMTTLARCFDNVFISSSAVSVKWGEYGVLNAEVICLRELWNHSTKWRYFINLTGQEFPLKTNYELVKILKAYDGANDVHGDIGRKWRHRWQHLSAPPDNLYPVKGHTHVVLSRAFVDYALTSEVSARLLNWSRGVDIPDEIFFSTLNFNRHLNVPGSYDTDNATLINAKPYLARYKLRKRWSNAWECRSGIFIRTCIFGIADLTHLPRRKELFANKFHWNQQSKVAEYCMSEYIYNTTKQGYFGNITFNDEYYRNLEFVKHKL